MGLWIRINTVHNIPKSCHAYEDKVLMTDGRDIFLGYYTDDKFYDLNGDETNNITHWSILPELPEFE